jgi:hypothetical protein
MDSSEQFAKDGCPVFVERMIDQLREVEIILGNVPKALEWRSEHVAAISKSVIEEVTTTFTNHHTEIMFDRIVHRLRQDGFAADAIMGFINARIGYKGGPQYCSLEEVELAYSLEAESMTSPL